MKFKPWIYALVGCLTVFATPIYAADFEDDLNSLWEVLWDERGAVGLVTKWDKTKTHYYRVTGDFASVDKAHVERSIAELHTYTGLKIVPAPVEMADQDLPIEYRFVKKSDLDARTACQAEKLDITGFQINKAIIKIKPGNAFHCIHHETMHLVGLRGHPEGKTVLSYFPWREDAYLRLDQIMLKAQYSDDMAMGTTAITALDVMADFLLKDAFEYGVSMPELAQRKQAFFKKLMLDMEAFAMGKGEIPKIILRSGRTNNDSVKHSRAAIPYALAMAYFVGEVVPKNLVQAQQWLLLAAQRDFVYAQYRLYTFYDEGILFDKNPVEAAKWLGVLQSLENESLKTLYAQALGALSELQKQAVLAWVSAFKAETNFKKLSKASKTGLLHAVNPTKPRVHR